MRIPGRCRRGFSSSWLLRSWRNCVWAANRPKKQQTMADTNLMAIQTLGKQMLSIANSINGHRMKSIMQNEANAKPINGYLAYVVEELRQAFGIKKEEMGGIRE